MRPISLFLVLAAACGKPAPTDDFSAVADGKADAFSSKMKVVGSLDYGATPLKVKYSKTPTYRAVSFFGLVGDPVDIWIRSAQGDAVGWLLDSSYKVVVKNDDADSNTSDSHLATTLPKSGTFYIVFRDYDYASHYFTVELDGPGGCQIKLVDGGSNASITGYDSALQGSGWELYTQKLPACTDLTDGQTQSRLREFMRATLVDDGSGRGTPLGAGGLAFVQSLDASLAATQQAHGDNAHTDSLESSIKGPILAAPDAFLEVKLTASCSESAVALIDTRTGIVYVIHQLPTC
jgi:hypothetical protein